MSPAIVRRSSRLISGRKTMEITAAIIEDVAGTSSRNAIVRPDSKQRNNKARVVGPCTRNRRGAERLDHEPDGRDICKLWFVQGGLGPFNRGAAVDRPHLESSFKVKAKRAPTADIAAQIASAKAGPKSSATPARPRPAARTVPIRILLRAVY